MSEYSPERVKPVRDVSYRYINLMSGPWGEFEERFDAGEFPEELGVDDCPASENNTAQGESTHRKRYSPHWVGKKPDGKRGGNGVIVGLAEVIHS